MPFKEIIQTKIYFQKSLWPTGVNEIHCKARVDGIRNRCEVLFKLARLDFEFSECRLESMACGGLGVLVCCHGCKKACIFSLLCMFVGLLLCRVANGFKWGRDLGSCLTCVIRVRLKVLILLFL